MKLTERKLRKIIREELNRLNEFGGPGETEIGLTAPEDADYELERVARGYSKEDAFRRLKMWAEENGYTVELTGDGTSVFDWTFSKNGSEQFVTVLNR